MITKLFRESYNKFFHLSFRGQDKKIDKSGYLKGKSYITDNLKAIYAFDAMNEFNNVLYEVEVDGNLVPDDDWELFKNFYKKGEKLLDEFTYFLWIGILYDNNVDVFKINLYKTTEEFKVNRINFKNNLKYDNFKDYYKIGAYACYKKFGECYNRKLYNYILFKKGSEYFIDDIVYYDNRKSFIINSGRHYFIKNNEFLLSKFKNKFEIMNYLEDKKGIELYFI